MVPVGQTTLEALTFFLFPNHRSELELKHSRTQILRFLSHGKNQRLWATLNF
jgi:hypothetical protein